MDSGAEEAPQRIRRALLEYGPAIVGAGLWAWSKFPEQMRASGDFFRWVFGRLAAFYEDWTEVEGYGDALEEALSEIRKPPSSILDIATGTGYVARRLKKLYPEAEVIGVDIAPEMIAVAQHQAASDGLDVTFEESDAADLAYEDNVFDLVVTQNAMPYPGEMMRVLAAGGVALIVLSFGGPWAAAAWRTLEASLDEAGATWTFGRRAGTGFFAAARKSG